MTLLRRCIEHILVRHDAKGGDVFKKSLRKTKSTITSMAGVTMGASIVLMYITACIENTILMLFVLTISMFFVGAGGGVLNVIVGSSMMKAVPKEMMARMSALNAAVMQSSMPVGAFICSALALTLGVTQIFLLFGILTIAMYIILTLARKIDAL